MKYDRPYSGIYKYKTQKGIQNLKKQPLYTTWRMMNVRCFDDRHKAYHRYGGRGITVCENWRWDNPFGLCNFIKDVGERPLNHTLDKINNDGDYYPDNVRWATKRTQQSNLGTGLSNTSGHIGVRLVNKNYESRILLNGKSFLIATFNIEDYDKACDLYNSVRIFKLNHTDDETVKFIKSFTTYSPTNKKLRINKTSKYYGVSWDSSRDKWRAMSSYRKSIDGKVINKMVGRFDSEDDAYNAILEFLEWVKVNGFYKKLANKELM